MIVLWSFWNFLRQGRGTPAPVEPPKELVAAGFYRYVRNPMYVGVLAVNLGHVLWLSYGSLLLFPGLVVVILHLFVAYDEEPTLRKTFGAAYEDYLQQVPRWSPCFRYSPASAAVPGGASFC